MTPVQTRRDTLDNLLRHPGKAELVGGRIVPQRVAGRRPSRIAAKIFRSLDDYAQSIGVGEAYTDNLGFAVPALPSGRESFSPDASYHAGPFNADPMRFIEGPPTLAVEVRSESDYGNAAELEMAAKRNDYLTAGTLVVWDVDTINECISVYKAGQPDLAATFRRGEQVEAEPAVPGWSVAVDWVFG